MRIQLLIFFWYLLVFHGYEMMEIVLDGLDTIFIENYVGSPLCDHYLSGVGVTGQGGRHDRSIHNSQSLQTMNSATYIRL